MSNENLTAMQPEAPQFKPPKVLTRKTKRIIFYILMITLPFLQFVLFYLYVNIDSILLAFQKYNKVEGQGFVPYFSGFDNFEFIFGYLNDGRWYMVEQSFWLYVTKLFLGTGLALIFSYYIYKKFMFTELFRVFLYLPSIVSSIVLTLLYKYIIVDFYMGVTGDTQSLLSQQPFLTVLFYNLYISFGVNVLMYCGTMSGINESVVESAHLDGVNIIQEFFYITIPMIYPTLVTFIVTGIAHLFTDQMNLFTFFREEAVSYNLDTVGYHLYIQSLKSGLMGSDNPANTKEYLTYSQISAFGLMITALILPITLAVKHYMTKWGPSAD